MLMSPSVVFSRVTVAFAADDARSATLDVFTFSGLSLGTAKGNRSIVVGVSAQTFNRTISSVTVAGSSAAELFTLDTANDVSAFYAVALPSGTSGDVVVTLSGAVGRCGVGVWAVYGADISAAHDSYSSATAGNVLASSALEVPARGVCLAFGNDVGTGVTGYEVTIKDTGTPDYEEFLESPDLFHGGDSYENTEGAETIDIRFNGQGTTPSRQNNLAISLGR